MVAHAPALEAPALGSPSDFAVAQSSRSGPVAAALLAVLCATVALAFGLIHRQLAIHADAAYARRAPFAVSSHPGREAIMFSFGPFLAVMVGAAGLAALKHRLAAFWLFALVAMTPIVQSALGALPADRSSFFIVGPNPLGAFWTTGVSFPTVAHLWHASAIDYGLALLPALAITAWTIRDDTRPSPRVRLANAFALVRRPRSSQFAGALCSVFLFWLVLHTWELRQALQGSPGPGTRTDAIVFVPFFLLGVVLARGSAWRFPVLIAVPVLWSTAWIPSALAGEVHGPTMSDVHDAIPYVAVVAAGISWHAIATALDRQSRPTWPLVGMLNALNVADALLTRIAVHSGQAAEVNPVAAWIGPGAKIAAVGVASVLLARFRPRAIPWLVLASAAVVAWHLSGVLLDNA